MSKLVTNDDGTVTIPLLGGKEPIVLTECSVLQLAEMTMYAAEADDQIPDVPTDIDTENAASMLAGAAVMRDRTLKTYSTDAPYGMAVVKIVKLLTGEAITLEDLPSWAASPQTCRDIIGHFQTP